MAKSELGLLESAVHYSSDQIVVDGWAAIKAICEEYALDHNSEEHQHEALIELDPLIDALAEASGLKPIVVW